MIKKRPFQNPYSVKFPGALRGLASFYARRKEHEREGPEDDNEERRLKDDRKEEHEKAKVVRIYRSPARARGERAKNAEG